jgi:lysozyme
MGLAGLLQFTNTLAAVREGRYEDAASGMLTSLWARQVGPRATRLAEMMRTGGTT